MRPGDDLGKLAFRLDFRACIERAERAIDNNLSERTLRFTDVTERAGVGWRAYGMGAATGDFDNNGTRDIYDDAYYAAFFKANRAVIERRNAYVQARGRYCTMMDWERDDLVKNLGDALKLRIVRPEVVFSRAATASASGFVAKFRK